MDETGGTTHGKDDCKQGGKKKVVLCVKIPKEEAGVNNSNYTLAPFTDLNGDLCFLVLIFFRSKDEIMLDDGCCRVCRME